MVCRRGARWVQQNILEVYPDEDIAVYAIWFNMLAGEDQSRWEHQLLSDHGVLHYWDEGRVVGTFHGDQVFDATGYNVWDAYFVYDTQDFWTDLPPEHMSFAVPIIRDTDGLQLAVEALITEEQ